MPTRFAHEPESRFLRIFHILRILVFDAFARDAQIVGGSYIQIKSEHNRK